MGIYIGGTGSANLYDDYEEGTWTPGITWSGGTSVAGTSNYGYYVKTGCLVGVYATINWTSFNASPTASYARITGLPFPYKNATAYRSSALLGAQLAGLDGGTTGKKRGEVATSTNLVKSANSSVVSDIINRSGLKNSCSLHHSITSENTITGISSGNCLSASS